MGSIQVVFILEKIRIMWESILPRSIYRKSMCNVLGSVFSRITRDMLLIDDMAAEETLQVMHVMPYWFEVIHIMPYWFEVIKS